MGGAWLHMEIWELLSDACLLIKSFHEQNLCENIFNECNNGSCNIWRDHRVRLTCAAIFALPRASWTHWRRFLNCSFSCTSFGGFTLQPIYNNASKIHFSHRLWELLTQPQGVEEIHTLSSFLFHIFILTVSPTVIVAKEIVVFLWTLRFLCLPFVSFRTQGFSVLCLLSSLIFTEVFEDSYWPITWKKEYLVYRYIIFFPWHLGEIL